MKSKTPFFLTGGTALSRYYFNHRYSDDLDFFVINDSNYMDHLKTVLSCLSGSDSLSLSLENISIGNSFTRLNVNSISNPEIILQLDFINDVAMHYGEFVSNLEFGKIDNWRNILSNKLTALFRSEPKDVADIWIISKNKKFNWQDIVKEAKSKEGGIEPEMIYEILKSFPINYIENIKWVKEVELNFFKEELHSLADDILYGRNNSLCS